MRSPGLAAILAALLSLPGCRNGAPKAAPGPDWSARGENPGDDFGSRATGLGDFDGDGYGDLALSAPGYAKGRGRVYVYRGGPQGPSPRPDWVLDAPEGQSQFGRVLAGAADYNGDRLGDLAAVSGGVDGNGEVRIHYGSRAGLQAKPGTVIKGRPGDGLPDCCLSQAGDVNGDGFEDLMLGACYAGEKRGQVRLHLGSAQGLTGQPAWTFSGEDAGEEVGYSLGPAGDVNGDGYGDYAVGGKFNSRAGRHAGKAYLFLGGPGGLGRRYAWSREGTRAGERYGNRAFGLGDLEGRGRHSFTVVASEWGAAQGLQYVYAAGADGSVTERARVSGSQLGMKRIGERTAALGDFNGDGRGDFFTLAVDEKLRGGVLLFLGGREGLLSPAWSRFEEGRQGTLYADWAAAAGDVNGDGMADLLVSATQEPGGGAAYLFFGNPIK